MIIKNVANITILTIIIGCSTTEESSKVKLMTLDPGHFHAALIQKTSYDDIDTTVDVFAPDGPEVRNFLNKIEGYNTRN